VFRNPKSTSQPNPPKDFGKSTKIQRKMKNVALEWAMPGSETKSAPQKKLSREAAKERQPTAQAGGEGGE
jgi:hypothetical protein